MAAMPEGKDAPAAPTVDLPSDEVLPLTMALLEDASTNDRKSLAAWVEERRRRWVDDEGGIRSKRPTTAALDAWMAKQCKKALDKKGGGSGARTSLRHEHFSSAKQAFGRAAAVEGGAAGAGAGGMPRPDAWAEGLTPKKQRVWLLDCYRMRLDDEYVYRTVLRGLYNIDNSVLEVVQAFAVFCKLALANGVIPRDWDWAAFLKHAAPGLGFAFEKSDAKEKYGGENVFNAMMGGRSLRYTAEIALGSGVQAHDAPEFEDTEAQALEALTQAARGDDKVAWLDKIGGAQAWRAVIDNAAPLEGRRRMPFE